ncbi:MAG: hypothetical protein GF350_12915 [Chitinivibrionales bacterium]|nr:hypothetical protein [Chitinivibrionales bacterium]
MRSEALDIVIESKGTAIWLILSGPFHNEQIPNMREKIEGMIEDGSREIVVDMEAVTDVGNGVVPAFLGLLNTIQGKNGRLRFIFRNPVVSRAFAPYRNLFAVYPDAPSLAAGGFLGSVRRRSEMLFKKTGIRISRPVALFLLVVIAGWFISLGFIIHLQNERIHTQEVEIRNLTEWQKKAEKKIQILRERIRPMEQLGLLPDSAEGSDD